MNAILRSYAKACGQDSGSYELHIGEAQWDYETPAGDVLPVTTQKVWHGSDSVEDCHEENPVDVKFQFVQDMDPESIEEPENPGAMSLSQEEEQQVQQLSPEHRQRIRVEIEKAHCGMGHPHQDRFLRILRKGGASSATLGLAKSFRCSQCHENRRPQPWRRSAPPKELPFNTVVGVDCITLKHHDHSLKCLNVICWGSRYQMIIPLHGNRTIDARNAYRQ